LNKPEDQKAEAGGQKGQEHGEDLWKKVNPTSLGPKKRSVQFSSVEFSDF